MWDKIKRFFCRKKLDLTDEIRCQIKSLYYDEIKTAILAENKKNSKGYVSASRGALYISNSFLSFINRLTILYSDYDGHQIYCFVLNIIYEIREENNKNFLEDEFKRKYL